MIWFWVALGILLLAAEVYTTAFYAVFLAAGCLAAAVATEAGADILVQTVVGAAVAIAGSLLARPLLLRVVARRVRAPSSFPGLVGQGALTTDAVGDEHHPGHVVLGGERWLAVTDAAPLGAETEVTVIAVQGTTLLVRPSANVVQAQGSGNP